MPLPVQLKAVVDEMEFGTEEWRAFINRKTGELASFPGDTLRAAEGDEEPAYAGDFEPEDLENCRRVLADEDFIELPNKEDIREYDIMERFSLSYPDEDLRERLLDAIDGRGAFRRFKNLIHRKGIADEWYRYRDDAVKRIAADFLEAHDIAYVGDGQRRGSRETELD
ncbi:MAG TPA: UPF0158 family protein [Hyphomicrobiaceae bacterium]|jgi:hypothetical protein